MIDAAIANTVNSRAEKQGIGAAPAVCCLLLGLLNVSLALNVWNNDVPLGYHVDEPKKAYFIQSGKQDFHHPLFMLELVRGANAVLGNAGEQEIAVLGRTIVGIIGTCGVALLFWLSRCSLSPTSAILTALAFAISPIWTLHAHYLKEDVLLTCTLLLCLSCLVRLVETNSGRWTVAFGIALGAAMSSHYKAVLFVVLAVLSPLLHSSLNARRYYARLFRSVVIGGCLFLLINWPLFQSADIFAAGIRHSAGIAIGGHEVSIGPLSHCFCFHLIYSLAPGMGLGMAVLSLTWIAYSMAHWRTICFADRFMLAYGLVFYLAVECSPLKPAPDYARYVLPVVPVLCHFSIKCCELICKRLPRAGKVAAMSCLSLLLIGPPAWDSIMLDYNLVRDTREIARAEHIAGVQSRAVCEQYAGVHADVRSVAAASIEEYRASGVEFLAVSSFMYDRYELGSRLRDQPPAILERHKRYERLFSLPYTEIRPLHRSSGFSNPTIRIIDIRTPGKI